MSALGHRPPLACPASRSALLLRADAVCKFGLGRDGPSSCMTTALISGSARTVTSQLRSGLNGYGVALIGAPDMAHFLHDMRNIVVGVLNGGISLLRFRQTSVLGRVPISLLISTPLELGGCTRQLYPGIGQSQPGSFWHRTRHVRRARL